MICTYPVRTGLFVVPPHRLLRIDKYKSIIFQQLFYCRAELVHRMHITAHGERIRIFQEITDDSFHAEIAFAHQLAEAMPAAYFLCGCAHGNIFRLREMIACKYRAAAKSVQIFFALDLDFVSFSYEKRGDKLNYPRKKYFNFCPCLFMQIIHLVGHYHLHRRVVFHIAEKFLAALGFIFGYFFENGKARFSCLSKRRALLLLLLRLHLRKAPF